MPSSVLLVVVLLLTLRGISRVAIWPSHGGEVGCTSDGGGVAAVLLVGYPSGVDVVTASCSISAQLVDAGDGGGAFDVNATVPAGLAAELSHEFISESIIIPSSDALKIFAF